MGIGGDAVLGRREVGCLVARELHRAAGEIDELVAIHGTPFLLFYNNCPPAACAVAPSNHQLLKSDW
jgi:hypothetical protein